MVMFILVCPCTMRCSPHTCYNHVVQPRFISEDCRDAHWILSFCGQVVEVLQKAGAEDGGCCF